MDGDENYEGMFEGLDYEGMLGELETRLEVGAGFLKGLEGKDDWTYLVAVNSFFEGVVTEFVKVYFDSKEVEGFISRLPMGGDSGKLPLIGTIFTNYFDVSSEIRFLYALGELRNKLVHDVTNYGLRLDGHLPLLD